MTVAIADHELVVVVVSETIFPVSYLSAIVFVVICLAFSFIFRSSSCIVSLLPLKFASILILDLSGRRKTCVNHAHAKQEETQERQGCLGMGRVTRAS